MLYVIVTHFAARGYQCERAILCNEVDGYEVEGWCHHGGQCGADGTCKCLSGKCPRVIRMTRCWARAKLLSFVL
jgi:hypothetical protein